MNTNMKLILLNLIALAIRGTAGASDPSLWEDQPRTFGWIFDGARGAPISVYFKGVSQLLPVHNSSLNRGESFNFPFSRCPEGFTARRLGAMIMLICGTTPDAITFF